MYGQLFRCGTECEAVSGSDDSRPRPERLGGPLDSGAGERILGRIGGLGVEPLAGRLLVATPALKDPNFERTVVLVVAHEPGGSIGVVLNRATEVAGRPTCWTAGARSPTTRASSSRAARCSRRPRSASPGRARQPAGSPASTGYPAPSARSTSPKIRKHCSRRSLRVRVFAGYAGWGEGQLESEIETGSWFVFDALPGDAFVSRPDDLWPMVLRRQGGLMAAVAIFPPIRR